jgi:uncharacterized protein with von Willebrand factor type A (vWA) domain
MTAVETKALLLDVFYRLIRVGANLGVAELLAAYHAVDGGWGAESPDALRKMSRLLWCNSRQEAADFDDIFSVALAARKRAEKTPDLRESEPKAAPPESPAEMPHEEPTPSAPPPELPQREGELEAFPVRTPAPAVPMDGGAELRAYWPVSRRSMIYTWRYLRRPIKDGPRTLLDVTATIERAARQGFFLQPVFNRRESNRAHLVLFVDQGGSMVPFHRFTRDLVETACDDSGIQQVDVFYFNNAPPKHVFLDPHMTEPLLLADALAGCTPDSSVLLVSDAGAARGYRSMERVRAVAEALVRVKRVTSLIAWLNPMPRSRWPGTSAQFIARLIPMYQMDPDGFSNAVDALRGQPLHPHG